MIFDDSDLNGYHGDQIRRLVKYWCDHGYRGRLDVALIRRFLDNEQPELAETISAGAHRGVGVVGIEDGARGNGGRLLGALSSGRLVHECVQRVRPDKCLLMGLDGLRLPLAFGLRFNFPVKFAGIYLSPMFHYRQCGFSTKRGDRFRALHQKHILWLTARNRHLETIFCADPYSVPPLAAMAPGVRVLSLPDPVDLPRGRTDISSFKQSLRIEHDRLVLLLFGLLSRRKGIFQTLEALRLLSEQTIGRICLVLAGKIPESDRPALLLKVNEISELRRVQIIVRDERIPEHELDNFFAAADLVLLPYQHHVGDSAVLMRAAAAGVPVLAQDYGLIGQLVRRRNLGITVDTSDPEEIAKALERSVQIGCDALLDRSEARSFAAENSTEKFACTIFQGMGLN